MEEIKKYSWILFILIMVLSGCAKTPTYLNNPTNQTEINESNQTTKSVPSMCVFSKNIVCIKPTLTETPPLTIDVDLYNRGPYVLYDVFVVPNDVQADCTPKKINPFDTWNVNTTLKVHCTNVVATDSYGRVGVTLNVSARQGSKITDQTFISTGIIYQGKLISN